MTEATPERELRLSAVVVVRDEAAMLPGCLRSLAFADEIVVVVDDRTVDESADLARDSGALVLKHRFVGFADLKNAGIDAARATWILVVDADERVDPSLALEILSVLDGETDAYDIERINYFYGQRISHGGWPERLVRLVRAGTARYEGDLHETFARSSRRPVGHLMHPLHHFTHREVLENLEKTANYTEVWAQERHRNNAPRVRTRTLFYVYFRELVYRLIVKQGWRDGTVGVIESLYQPFSILAGRVRLWELQQEPSIAEQYRILEEAIARRDPEV